MSETKNEEKKIYKISNKILLTTEKTTFHKDDGIETKSFFLP